MMPKMAVMMATKISNILMIVGKAIKLAMIIKLVTAMIVMLPQMIDNNMLFLFS